MCPICYIDSRIIDYDNSAKTNILTLYFYLYFILFSIALFLKGITYGNLINVLMIVLIILAFKSSITTKIKMRKYKKVRINELQKEKEYFLMKTGFYTG